MNLESVAPYLAYILGAAAGVVVPYVRKYLVDGTPFDWRKVGGKILATLLGLLLMPGLAGTLEALGGLGWAVAFGMGIAATTVGHEAQQLPAAWRAGQAMGRLWGK